MSDPIEPIVHASLAAALVGAQADMPKLKPDAKNPHFKNEYVSLDNLLENAVPVLTRHGIAVVQMPTTLESGDVAMTTTLIHGPTGERESSTMKLILSKSDMQGLGSAITYARRYMLTAALGIAEGEDDDGNAASEEKKAEPKPTADQKRRLAKALDAGVKVNAERFSDAAVEKLAKAKFSKTLEDLSRPEFGYVVEKIEKALEDAGAGE